MLIESVFFCYAATACQDKKEGEVVLHVRALVEPAFTLGRWGRAQKTPLAKIQVWAGWKPIYEATTVRVTRAARAVGGDYSNTTLIFTRPSGFEPHPKLDCLYEIMFSWRTITNNSIGDAQHQETKHDVKS